VIFSLFSTDWNSASSFAFYDTHIEILKKQYFSLILALFANFKAKIRRNGSKNEKRN
jgi:hypothetical protein